MCGPCGLPRMVCIDSDQSKSLSNCESVIGRGGGFEGTADQLGRKALLGRRRHDEAPVASPSAVTALTDGSNGCVLLGGWKGHEPAPSLLRWPAAARQAVKKCDHGGGAWQDPPTRTPFRCTSRFSIARDSLLAAERHDRLGAGVQRQRDGE